MSVVAADAFKNTSPFFFYSTSEVLAPSHQIASAASLSEQMLPELEKCLSDTYIVVSQPGVNAADYSNRLSMPHMRKAMLGNDKQIRSSFAVSDVLGVVVPNVWANVVKEKCTAEVLNVDASTGSFDVVDDMKPRVIMLDFPPLPGGPSRQEQSLINFPDAFLSSVIDLLPSTKFSVLYLTTPVSADQQNTIAENRVYEMENVFSPSLHMGLKRDLSTEQRDSSDNITLIDGPLFERYQFLSPGIFMGVFIGLTLLSILYVAISGVSGLQVSYAAFDKENGPAAQKKQQQ
ncbi:hypothetical protein MMC06_003773 [Schaereria dolodes]|nr:hypothetical protein [Schaereria dolodes]